MKGVKLLTITITIGLLTSSAFAMTDSEDTRFKRPPGPPPWEREYNSSDRSKVRENADENFEENVKENTEEKEKQRIEKIVSDEFRNKDKDLQSDSIDPHTILIICNNLQEQINIGKPRHDMGNLESLKDAIKLALNDPEFKEELLSKLNKDNRNNRDNRDNNDMKGQKKKTDNRERNRNQNNQDNQDNWENHERYAYEDSFDSRYKNSSANPGNSRFPSFDSREALQFSRQRTSQAQYMQPTQRNYQNRFQGQSLGFNGNQSYLSQPQVAYTRTNYIGSSIPSQVQFTSYPPEGFQIMAPNYYGTNYRQAQNTFINQGMSLPTQTASFGSYSQSTTIPTYTNSMELNNYFAPY